MNVGGGSSDDRGAVMLIAVFFSIFALGVVFSTVGTAQTLFFREHLQDAADAAALSGAVMSARGMNLLVLINIVMAALLAILVTIKLVEALTIIGMAVAAAVAWIFPAALAAIPPLKMIQSEMRSAYKAAKPPIDQALEGLHAAANAVQDATPLAVDAAAEAAVGVQPVKAGFVTSSQTVLPVEDDSFKELCTRAGKVPVDLAAAALKPIGGALLRRLQGPMGSLAGEFSHWFCGDAGKDPPADVERLEVAHPRMPWNLACDDEHIDVPLGTSALASLGPLCTESQLKDQQAKPDDQTGECQSETDCSLGSPYDQRVVQARVECDPSSKPPPFAYKYQRRRGHVTYTWQGKLWKRGDPSYDRPGIVETNTPPCVTWSRSGMVRTYNPVVRQGSDVREVLPLCSDETPPPISARDRPIVGATHAIDFTETRQMLACKKMEDVPIKVTADKSSGDGGESRSPKRVQSGTTLGSEAFQIRAVMQGDLGTHAAGQLVRFALWNQASPSDAYPNLRELAGYSTAEAEYFFDGTGGSDAWMWDMQWRARLRRFRTPTDSALASFLALCTTALSGKACGILLANLERVGTVAH